MIAKPTIEDLGIDPDAQEWQRSGDGAGVIEIAFARVTSIVTGGASAVTGGASAVTGGASAVPGGASAVPGEASAVPGEASAVPGVSGVFVTSGGSDRPGTAEPGDGNWILMRVADDPERRVLVFDRNEWECFLDGARKGEFDDAAAIVTS